MSKRFQRLVFLAQSDTTAGFLSASVSKLNKIKNRPLNKPCIECISSLSVKNFRVSNSRYKTLIRRAKKMTFILQNGYSFRVVKEPLHLEFLKKFNSLYSTSANETNKHFSLDFAKNVSDVIVCDERGFFESAPSKILKLGKTRIKKVR